MEKHDGLTLVFHWEGKVKEFREILKQQRAAFERRPQPSGQVADLR